MERILWKSNRFFIILFILFAAAAFSASKIPGSYLDIRLFEGQDKLFHFIEFLLIAFSGYVAFRKRRNFRSFLFLFAIFFAFADEFFQQFVPGRAPDVSDFAVDLIPFVLIFFIKTPLKVNSVSVSGLYDRKVFDLLRSVIPGIYFDVDGSGELLVHICPDHVDYTYKGSLILSSDFKQIRKDPSLGAKNRVYRDFESFLDRRISPWGLLFQTRPSKIMERIENGDSIRTLKREYRVSGEKARLLRSVYEKEQSLEQAIVGSGGLYLGIPFCPSKCSYCSFTSYPREKYAKYYKPFVNALTMEMEGRLHDSELVDFIYIGGGTPFTLDEKELDMLLSTLARLTDASAIREFTVEAGRPELFTDEKCAILREHGVNRIAINPQTFNDNTLKRVGRLSTAADFHHAYKMSLRHGFEHINADLIIGLPGETGRDHIRSVRELSRLEKIDNVTIHALSPKRGAAMRFDDSASSANIAGSLKTAGKILKREGFAPYYLYKQRHITDNLENVGYARQDAECLYNIAMISEKTPIMGFGVGASSKRIDDGDVVTIKNPKDLSLYINSMEKKYG